MINKADDADDADDGLMMTTTKCVNRATLCGYWKSPC